MNYDFMKTNNTYLIRCIKDIYKIILINNKEKHYKEFKNIINKIKNKYNNDNNFDSSKVEFIFNNKTYKIKQ